MPKYLPPDKKKETKKNSLKPTIYSFKKRRNTENKKYKGRHSLFRHARKKKTNKKKKYKKTKRTKKRITKN